MSEAVVSHERPHVAETGGRRILFSAVRNEGPFLIEWIAYHLAIGFDTIIIASNDCTDGTAELLDALQDAGELTHIAHTPPDDVFPQAHAGDIANRSGLLKDGDWVIWLDPDEFLNIHVGEGHLDDLIAQMGGARAIMLNWRIFGSNGQSGLPDRFVSDAFDRASSPWFRENISIKTFWQVGEDMRRFSLQGVYRPRIEAGNSVDPQSILNGRGEPVAKAHKRMSPWLAGVDGWNSCYAPREDFSWSVAQINHYMVRTPELLDLKRQRGRGRQAKSDVGAAERYSTQYRDRNDRNERRDRTILRRVAPMEGEIERLLSLPGVQSAHERTRDLTRRRIEGLAPPAPALTFPADEAAHVRAAYAAADCILEYGSGGSTMLAAEQGTRLVMSVESDNAWADDLRRSIAARAPAGEVHVVHADIGATRSWGRPRGARGRARFHLYPLGVWDAPFFEQPDLVLIDGRFRTACFAAVMMRTTRAVTVLFDDYVGRPEYHVVERFFRPHRTIGRMAEFTVTPTTPSPKDMTDVIGWFQIAR